LEIPKILTKYDEHIQSYLKIIIDSHAKEDMRVYNMLKYCFGWEDKFGNKINATTGKGLRPSLCLFATESLGGSFDKSIYAASSIELIHNFSLIHDEIQDLDEFRHHRPTLWTIWGSEKALVSGDILRIIADISIENLLINKDDTALHLECTKLLTQACLEMIEGQYLDITFEKEINVSLEQYMNMISKKTGALIRCSLNIGALIASKNKNTLEVFRDAGTDLGYGFQIRDDILGIWGTEDSTGKPVGLDIKRKKKSIPILHAINAASDMRKEILIGIFAKEQISDHDVTTVLDIMDETKSLEYSENLSKEYCYKSIDHIYDAKLNQEFTNDFIDLAKFLALRDF